MTGQHPQHHAQRLQATLIVPAAAVQILRGASSPHSQIEQPQRSKDFDQFGRFTFIVL
jgi:hypothetical protein